jgi:hypothetical protein
MVAVAAPVTPVDGVFVISLPLVSDASTIESSRLKSSMMSICRNPQPPTVMFANCSHDFCDVFDAGAVCVVGAVEQRPITPLVSPG